MSSTDLLLVAVAAVAGLWPQISRLLGIGGKKDDPREAVADIQKIVAEVLRLLQGGGQSPVAPLVPSPSTALDKAEAMARLLAVEADLRRAGFTAAADQTAAAARTLLTPAVPA